MAILKVSLKLRFDRSGYYFILLVFVAILGFWPTYFSKLFDRGTGLAFYLHFHALVMALWLATLIIQPILIKRKNLEWHRVLGKFTYVLMPLLFVSVILLTHHRLPNSTPETLAVNLFVPFKDLFIIGLMYGIAIWYRQVSAIHARAMIVTGLACIEPALVRFMAHSVFPPGAGIEVYLVTIGIIYSILLLLIFLERGQTRGRWVFPVALGLFVTVHALVILEMPIGLWHKFAFWFASLPLS